MVSMDFLMRQRIEYLDIAKGIAFLLVVYCHAVAFSDMSGVDSVQIHNLRQHGTWYQYFYMPAFFIVSGFFINTNKSFKSFLWQNIKLLFLGVIGIQFLQSLINNIVSLDPMGMIDFFKKTFMPKNVLSFWGAWFIGAIFIARIIFFVFARIAKNEILLAILLLAVAIGGGHIRKTYYPQYIMASAGNGIIHIYLHRGPIEEDRFKHTALFVIRQYIRYFFYGFTTIGPKHYR